CPLPALTGGALVRVLIGPPPPARHTGPGGVVRPAGPRSPAGAAPACPTASAAPPGPCPDRHSAGDPTATAADCGADAPPRSVLRTAPAPPRHRHGLRRPARNRRRAHCRRGPRSSRCSLAAP